MSDIHFTEFLYDIIIFYRVKQRHLRQIHFIEMFLFLLCSRCTFHGNIFYRFCDIVCRKLINNFLCTVNDHIRQTGKFCHLDTITFICPAFDNLS